MGFSTKFTGTLFFTSPITENEINKLNTIFGENCEYHLEWGENVKNLGYMDLEMNKYNSGIIWDGSEKTYFLVEKINLLINIMKKDFPSFGLSGEFSAQDDYDDVWVLYINENGIAKKKEMIIEESLEIETLSRNLINFVIEKYEIKSYNDFTCEHHKELAKALKIF